MEYQSLPLICFGCGRYGHNKDACPFELGKGSFLNMGKDQ